MKSEKKIRLLIEKLKKRNNKSYEFFEGLLSLLKDKGTAGDAEQQLSTCFAITQYGNFTDDEERLLSEIIGELDENTNEEKNP